MKTLATSLVLAGANLILLFLLFLGRWAHIGVLGSLPGVTSLVIVPFLVLVTLGFAIRDLFRPSTRKQAVLALVLSIPIGIMYSLTTF